jgi:hypothetical protein
MNCWAGAISTVSWGILGLAAMIARNYGARRIDWPSDDQLLVFCTSLAAVYVAGLISLGLLSEGIRQELESRSAEEATAARRRAAIWRIVLYAVIGSAIWGCSAAVMMFVTPFTSIPFISRQFWWITLAVTVIGLPMTLLQAWHWRALTRHFDHWDSLDLHEGQPA